MKDDIKPFDEKSKKLIKKEESNEAKKVFEITKSDYGYSAAKAGLASVPVIGGVLGEIFSSGINSPFHKRLANYLIPLEERIKELEKSKKINSNQLFNNEEFIDVISKSAQIAVTISQQEKLEALRNIVLNSVIGTTVEQDQKMMCLNVVDRITPSHLKVLMTLAEPEEITVKILEKNQGLRNFIIPEDFNKYHLKIDEPTFNVILNDLKTLGVMVPRGSHTMGLSSSSTSAPSSGIIGTYHCTPEGSPQENVIRGGGGGSAHSHTISSTPQNRAIYPIITESREYVTPFGWKFLSMVSPPKLKLEFSEDKN